MANDLRQKSKCTWLTKGDDNTRFFHAKMATRRHLNNSFHVVDEEGQVVKSEEQVCKEMITYYEALFNCEQAVVVFLDITCETIISEFGKNHLNKDISCDEVKVALFDIAENKAPGPDGFNSKFFQFH